MSEHMREAPLTAPVDCLSEKDEAIAEVSLLMPYRQLEALEKAASSRGMTIAHLLRRLIRNWVEEFDDPQAAEEPGFREIEAKRGITA